MSKVHIYRPMSGTLDELGVLAGEGTRSSKTGGRRCDDPSHMT